jgi:hypothetical protein
LEPDIALSDTAHDFGARVYGSVSAWSLKMINEGTDDLHVSSIVSDMVDYQVTSPSFPETLAAGDTVTVSTSFTAATAGSTSATLTVSSDDPDENPMTISLSGITEKAEVSASETDHAFGSVRIDKEESWGLEISNEGTGDLYVNHISNTNGDYVLALPAFPDTLAPAESLSVLVTFSPFSTGESLDTLLVLSNDAEDSTLAITLSGTGVTPALSLADSVHDFGEIATADSSDWDLLIYNLGTGPVTVDSMVADEGDFTAVSALPQTIAVGDTTAFTVRFNPESPGSTSAVMEVHSDDLENPVAWLQVMGTGVEPVIVLSAGSHNYGEVLVGEHADWLLIVHNQGNDDLALTSSATTDTVFAVLSPSLPDTVAAADSVEVQIRFTPIGEEIATAEISFWANDPGDSVTSVAVAGTGIRPRIYLTPESVEEVVFEDQAEEVLLFLRNTGTGQLAFWLTEWDTTLGAASSKMTLGAAQKFRSPALAKQRHRAQGALEAVLESDIPWLSADPLSDTLATGRARDVDLTLDASATSHGIYQAALRLESTDPESSLIWIPVKLKVPRMRFADHEPGSVTFTVADEGCYGFFDLGHLQAYGEGTYGSGFSFQDSASALFHGSLWIGQDSTHVMDGSYDYDWEVIPGGEMSMGYGTQIARAVYDDSGAASPVGLRVSQTSIAFPRPPDDDYVRLEFSVVNTTEDTLRALFAGLYFDWDVGYLMDNAGGYLPTQALGYMHNVATSDSMHYGICMLEPEEPSSFRLIHNPTYVHPTSDIADSVKFGFLTEGTVDSATWETSDWSMLLSSGPYDLAPGDSFAVAYAAVAGEGLTDILVNASQARSRLPVAVAPTFFEISVVDEGVELVWEMDGFVEFDISRSEDLEGEYGLVNRAPITCSSRCRFMDSDVLPGRTYHYRLHSAGRTLAGPVVVETPPPFKAGLLPNYPNPFSPKTTIVLELPRESRVEVTIYDLRGRRVRDLYSGSAPAGRTEIDWDGRNNAGQETAAGIYFCRFKVGSYLFSRKMVLLR